MWVAFDEPSKDWYDILFETHISTGACFRYAALHSLITTDETESWLQYGDNRNSTSHDYGEKLANTTLLLISEFIVDAKRLADVIDAA